MTVIENIKTGERWLIEDNIPFPANEYKIIGNLDDLLKEEKKLKVQNEIKAYISKCLLKPNFCEIASTYDFN